MRALATAALLVAALAAGCGSSPKPLTRAQLIEKANAICRRVEVKLEAANKGENVSSLPQLSRLASRVSAFEQSALGELTKLVPPAALEADWKRFVAGAQALAEDTASLSESSAAKDAAGARRVLAAALSTQKQMSAIAKRDRIKDCEQVP